MSGDGGFFDVHAKLTARPAPRAGATTPPDEILTVSQLTAKIDRVLKLNLPSTLCVKGEASNFSHNRASGHVYFTLKDVSSCVDCVMYRSDASRLKFTPEDGMELLATGRVSVYAQRGRYQLYVARLEPLGKGALELAFQQVRKKLQADGLFDPARKKPLPRYPTRIALVTSRQTAALQDMLKVLRRFPWIKLYLYHVPVQGDGAAEQIAAAISHLSATASAIGGVDLILLARGGGSLEDLWEFNEELLARALAACKIPVVSGVGHEVDVSIADLVADYHAHTPTEAAQVVTSSWRVVKDTIDTAGVRMRRELRQLLSEAKHRLTGIQRHELFRRPMDRINSLRQLLDDRQRSMQLAVGRRLRRASDAINRLDGRFQERHPRHALRLIRQRLQALEARLRRAAGDDQRRRRERIDAMAAHLLAVGPEQVLRRGYTITSLKKSAQVVRSASQLKGGERLVTRFADGTIESVAEDPVQLPLFE